MRIVVIIPSTCSDNKVPQLKSCLTSLTERHSNEILLDTIIVSNYKNNSAKISKLKVSKKIFVKTNTGFGEMNNIAIEKAIEIYNPDYILFINDDARVDKNFFKAFLKLFKIKNPDIIIPLVYEEGSEKIDSFGLKYFSSGYSSTVRTINEKSKFVSGSCFAANSTFLIKMIGKYGYCFNPHLYYYYEDTEFSIRAISMGGKIIQSKNIIAFHHSSYNYTKNKNFKFYYSYRNLLWLIILTWPLQLILKNIFKIIIFQFLVFWMLTFKFGVQMYFKIIQETVHKYKFLLLQRKNNIDKLILGANFNRQMDKRIFCTSKGFCI